MYMASTYNNKDSMPTLSLNILTVVILALQAGYWRKDTDTDLTDSNNKFQDALIKQQDKMRLTPEALDEWNDYVDVKDAWSFCCM